MTTHNLPLYHTETSQPDSSVIKQELVAYQQTASALRVTKLEKALVRDVQNNI